MNSYSTLSKPQFIDRLKKRKLENLEIVATVERFLKKKRGYVFRQPRRGEPVILLVSGGMDSIVAWAYLIEKYQYRVFPLYLNRGRERRRREGFALQYFSKLFQKRYGAFYSAPKEFTFLMPIPELEKEMQDAKTYLHPKVILDSLDDDHRLAEHASQYGMSIIVPLYGIPFARYLSEHLRIKVNTIFSAVTPEDGLGVPSQTLTSLRVAMLAMCTSTGDYHWNFSSVFFEKETGNWISKPEVIRLGFKLSLPLELAWSCYQTGLLHCGNCLSCISRREQFRRSGIKDRTTYVKDLQGDRFNEAWSSFKYRIKYLLPYSWYTKILKLKHGKTT